VPSFVDRPARSFSTYLFDLDGTLIDSVELILRSYRHTVRVHLGKVPPDELWLEGMGTPLWAQLGAFSKDPKVVDAMIATYREHNRRHHDELIGEYPGALEAVEALSRRGVNLGVVTSKANWSARRGLSLCGFDGLFPVVVGADDVDRHKPDPSPVLRALELLGAEPSESVFIGDSPHDLAAGRAAGVSTAAALWGPVPRHLLEPQEPDYWLTGPEEIISLGPAA
jgi:pyrophosphatase PpaX